MPGACTELPIANIAISHLEHIGKDKGQPLIQNSNLLVEWHPDQFFDGDEFDKDYKPDDDDSDANALPDDVKPFELLNDEEEVEEQAPPIIAAAVPAHLQLPLHQLL